KSFATKASRYSPTSPRRTRISFCTRKSFDQGDVVSLAVGLIQRPEKAPHDRLVLARLVDHREMRGVLDYRYFRARNEAAVVGHRVRKNLVVSTDCEEDRHLHLAE